MSMFSMSSKRSQYKNGNYGSNHYQKKGILGNLFDIIGSKSNSNRHKNQYPQQYPSQPAQNQQPMQQTTVNCGKCNSQIPRGSKFCLECGEKVNDVLHCMNCGEKLPSTAKFCLKCGAKTNG